MAMSQQQQHHQRHRQVALIGSSGGGTATLGHTDPLLFFQTLQQELNKLHDPSADNTNTTTSTVVTLSRIIFVSFDHGKGLDSANPKEDSATLYYQISLSSGEEQQQQQQQQQTIHNNISNIPKIKQYHGTLEQVNERVQELDVLLAQDISSSCTTSTTNSIPTSSSIDGLICISCKVELVSHTLQAIAKRNIPITGTGGTSLSLLSTKYPTIRLIGNSGGSVATTTITRVISYTNALAQDWNMSYQPWTTMTPPSTTMEKGNSSQQQSSSPPLQEQQPPLMMMPTWRSVLNSTLPAFWGVTLCKKLLLTTSIGDWLIPDLVSNITRRGGSTTGGSPPLLVGPVDILISGLESWALPLSCAIVMAMSRTSSHNSQDATSTSTTTRSSSNVPLMAVILASMACQQSILAGLIVGWIVPIVEERLLYSCIIRGNIPATMTTLITTGITGLIVIFCILPIVGPIRMVTQWFRTVVQWIPPPPPTTTVTSATLSSYYNYVLHKCILGLMGGIFCYGSKIGWYHTYFLPLILIEMELGNPSILGTIDQLTLVMVSAGICTGNIIIFLLRKMTTRTTKKQFKLKPQWANDTSADTPTNTEHKTSNEDISRRREEEEEEASLLLMKRGLAINILCGDFIEVCYPSMDQYWIINMGGYLASIWSTSLMTRNCQSSAYLPLPIAIWLTDDWYTMILCCLVAWGIPLLATLINHYIVVVPQTKKKKMARQEEQNIHDE